MSNMRHLIPRATKLRLPPPLHQPLRLITKVRLKWVKNRSLDHIISRDTEIKAAALLIEHLSHSPSPVPLPSLSPLHKSLGLTVPLLRFLRRYPTLFLQSPHPLYPSLPSFSLSPLSLLLRSRELSLSSSDSPSAASRLAKLLMMSRSRSLPLPSLSLLRYDLGLSPSFLTSLVPSRPDLFQITSSQTPPRLALTHFPSHLALSALQLRHPPFNRAPLTFPMTFPRRYGDRNKVKAWMDEFHRLPYFSPYEDWSGIQPESELMEKRSVGVLHELLSLMIYRKTKRNYIRGLREELGLPERFTRIFTRYPGIFYLSMKCKTVTAVLREGYERGRLVDPHPIAVLREKLFYVMRTGVLYRGKGMSKIVLDEDGLDRFEGEGAGEERFEDEVEDGESESELDSDED